MTITLNICATIASAMGPQVNRHLKILGAGIFSTLADAKVSWKRLHYPGSKENSKKSLHDFPHGPFLLCNVVFLKGKCHGVFDLFSSNGEIRP